MNKRIIDSTYLYPIFSTPYFAVTKFLIFFLITYSLLLYLNIDSINIIYLSFFFIPFLVFSILKKHLKIVYFTFAILIANFTYINFKFDNYQFDLEYINNQEVLVDGLIKDILFESTQSITFVADAKINSKFSDEINSQILMVLFKKVNININENERFKCKALISTFQDKVFPEEFPSKLYAISNKVNFHTIVKQKDFFIYQKASPFYQFTNNLKKLFNNQIRYLFPEDVAKIISAITIGEKSYLSKEEKEKHSLAGTSHIIAVSGLHVGIIAVILFYLTVFIKNEWIKISIIIAFVFLYVFATGLQASAIRAAIMASMLLIGRASNRHIEFINILSFSILIFIIISPEIIFSVSFQLSVAALLGIILYTDLILKSIVNTFKIENKLAYKILNIFSVTLAAMMFLSPISAYYFNTFSLTGLLANFYAIPLISLSLALSIPSILISFVSFDFAFLFGESITFLIRSIDYINNFLLDFEFLYVKNSLSILYAVGFLLIILIIYHSYSLKNGVINFALSSLLIATLYINFSSTEFYRDNLSYSFYIEEGIDKIDLYLVDKKEDNDVFKDRDLYQYLLSNKGKKLNLKFNDNNGQSIYDNLKDSIKIDTLHIKSNYPI